MGSVRERVIGLMRALNTIVIRRFDGDMTSMKLIFPEFLRRRRLRSRVPLAHLHVTRLTHVWTMTFVKPITKASSKNSRWWHSGKTPVFFSSFSWKTSKPSQPILHHPADDSWKNPNKRISISTSTNLYRHLGHGRFGEKISRGDGSYLKKI